MAIIILTVVALSMLKNRSVLATMSYSSLHLDITPSYTCTLQLELVSTDTPLLHKINVLTTLLYVYPCQLPELPALDLP